MYGNEEVVESCSVILLIVETRKPLGKPYHSARGGKRKWNNFGKNDILSVTFKVNQIPIERPRKNNKPTNFSVAKNNTKETSYSA